MEIKFQGSIHGGVYDLCLESDEQTCRVSGVPIAWSAPEKIWMTIQGLPPIEWLRDGSILTASFAKKRVERFVAHCREASSPVHLEISREVLDLCGYPLADDPYQTPPWG